MPNGGHICCEYCTYNRSGKAICDIHGVETSPGVLCRSFRMPKQPHREAKKRWPMLENLKPGIVYGISNNTLSSGNPKPIFKMVPHKAPKQVMRKWKEDFSILFRWPPENWGYRGDPNLWSDMEELFNGVAFPETEEKALRLIEGAFWELTGSPITLSEESIYIEKYDTGGMSGGGIHLEFWRREAIPLLLRRYESTMKKKHGHSHKGADA